MILASLIVAGLAASFFGDRPGTVQLTLSPEAPPLRPRRPRRGRGGNPATSGSPRSPQGIGCRYGTPRCCGSTAGEISTSSTRASRRSNATRRTASSRACTAPRTSAIHRTWRWARTGASGCSIRTAGGSRSFHPLEKSTDGSSSTATLSGSRSTAGMASRLRPSRRQPAVPAFLREWKARRGLRHLFSGGGPELATADGWMIAAGPGAFVYPFRHAGLLASYTLDGRLRYFRRTIDPLRFRPCTSIRPGGRRSTPRRRRPRSAAASWAATSSCSAPGPPRPAGAAVLDVYEVDTGAYRWSLHPPEVDARYVALTADRLFSASRRGVTIWRPVGR